ncbi:MAG: SDR family oxidoreductase [Bdellovibrionales bacterium]|nr:SDR family oxidoreductase [Bdellovibrionales bacterium]
MRNGALILGATGGVGSELCRALINCGWQLVLSGRNEESLSELSKELGAPYFVTDATDLSQIEKLCEFSSRHLENFRGAANCVGSIVLKPAHLLSELDFTSVLQQNLYSSFFLVKSIIPYFQKQGGSIVMFSSAAARIGIPNHEAIAAAKLGIEGLVRAAAASYAARGIRLNTVCPGLVDTPLTKKITGHPKSLEFSLGMHPLGRVGTVKDIASAATWLLDPRNSWITGQSIVVDGGLSGIKIR